ncbi:hypothetical protein IWW51_004619 [Coemansia sp. RSA 2702]|nr:hypothetical protein IWW51_004619 [Coemansia sp. RSA 2702]
MASKDIGAEFYNTVVAVEIKGSNMRHASSVIQGQLLQDFIDMAADQPRRIDTTIVDPFAHRAEFANTIVDDLLKVIQKYQDEVMNWIKDAQPSK